MRLDVCEFSRWHKKAPSVGAEGEYSEGGITDVSKLARVALVALGEWS